MNPLLNGVNPLMQNIGQIKKIMGMLKTANNPQAMLNQMMQSNPNYKQIQEIGQKYGGNYEKAFRETAKQMGIDPDEFLNSLK